MNVLQRLLCNIRQKRFRHNPHYLGALDALILSAAEVPSVAGTPAAVCFRTESADDIVELIADIPAPLAQHLRLDCNRTFLDTVMPINRNHVFWGKARGVFQTVDFLVISQNDAFSSDILTEVLQSFKIIVGGDTFISPKQTVIRDNTGHIPRLFRIFFIDSEDNALSADPDRGLNAVVLDHFFLYSIHHLFP